MGGEVRAMNYNKWAIRIMALLLLLGFALVMTYLHKTLVTMQRQQQTTRTR
jgi:hypothetical protein